MLLVLIWVLVSHVGVQPSLQSVAFVTMLTRKLLLFYLGLFVLANYIRVFPL